MNEVGALIIVFHFNLRVMNDLIPLKVFLLPPRGWPESGAGYGQVWHQVKELEQEYIIPQEDF